MLFEKYQSYIPQSIFSNTGNLATIIRVLSEEMDEALIAIQAVGFLTWIDKNEGVNLDNIGAILGELRRGLTDAAYKLILKIALVKASSKGDRTTIIQVLTVMGYTDIIITDGGATTYMDSLGFFDGTDIMNGFGGEAQFTVSALPDAGLLDLLNTIRAAGVRALVSEHFLTEAGDYITTESGDYILTEAL